MKKNIFLFLILSVCMVHANPSNDSISRFTFSRMTMLPCDACGCSANGGSMGFGSVYNNNFVGVRYFNQLYKSRDGIFNNSPWVNERFNTIQVWARIPVAKNIQISALVPYHFHERERTAANEVISGIGDLTVLGLYTVYQTRRDSAVFTHKLLAGAGVKAPTGKFNVENNKGSVNPGFQVGTGSWDYLLTAEYVVQRKKVGLQTMVNYTFKTENKKLYQFGDQLNYAGTFFYLVDLSKIQLVPQLGLAGEVYQGNHQYKQAVPNSAGDIIFTKFGFEAARKKFTLGFNAMLPLQQNLSNGLVESKYRWALNLNYSL